MPSDRFLRHVMRATGFCVLLLATTACSWLGVHEVEFRLVNRSAETLCLYPSQPDALAGDCLKELAPRGNAAWKLQCGEGAEARRFKVTVVITTKRRGEIIYDRTEECRIWQDSSREFVIEEEDGELVVSDGLP